MSLLSCTEKTDCDPQKTLVEILGDGVKKGIPYTGFDTLKFVRTNFGDTHTFVGTGIVSGYVVSSITTDPNCVDDITRTEYNSIQFNSIDLGTPITYEVFYRRFGEAPRMSIGFKGQKYLDAFTVPLSGPPYLDSIILQNRKYYNVITITDLNGSPPTNYYVLYNTHGILRIRLPGGENWELVGK